MDPQLLKEARSAFETSRIFRVGVLNRVSVEVKLASARVLEISDDLRLLEAKIAEAQRAHDLMQVHADNRIERVEASYQDRKPPRKRNRKSRKRHVASNRPVSKYRSNIRRRNGFGKVVAELSETRRDLVRELQKAKMFVANPRIVEKMYNLDEAHQTFYKARHLYLMAISLAEADEQGAAVRKHDMMRMAGIPEQYEPDHVWYYDYCYMGTTTIHFFYGGKQAPMGDEDETSPDGWGHGHIVLSIDRTGTCTIENSRPPLA